MCDFEPDTSSGPKPNSPNWLIFVDKAPDDGPWLRLMVLNPFNGAVCPVLNVAIEPEARL